MFFRLLHQTPLVSASDLESVLLQRIAPEAQSAFFAPPLPWELGPELHGIDEQQLQTAAERLRQAIRDQEKVVIFGDYDCDGVTSTAILWETLRHAGLVTRPFLPHREKHGYGLSVKALEEIYELEKPDLLITVDNGIVAHEAFAWLREQGIATILTDHHVPHATLPEADFIVHSTKLCGATVSWMLAHALSPEFAQQELDLAVLGTFADQVPLTGANRSFAVHGLQALRSTKRPSLRALAKVAGLDLSRATPHTIHYGLAPRINAMGRLYHALDALRALVSQQPERIEQLASALQDANLQRQAVTHEALQEMEKLVHIHKDFPLVVVAGPYHEGVIGLLAGKMVELTGKPSIVISTFGEIAKASARSVPAISLIEFLRSAAEVPYLALGGHSQAAGFSVRPEDLEKTITALRQAAVQAFQETNFTPHAEVLAPVAWSLLEPSITTVLDRFSPYGSGNEEPLFLLPSVLIQDMKPLGKNGAHRRLQISDDRGFQKRTAVCFTAEKRLPDTVDRPLDLIVKLQNSSYRPGLLDILVEGFAEN